MHRLLLLLLASVCGFAAEELGLGPVPASTSVFSGAAAPSNTHVVRSNGTTLVGSSNFTDDGSAQVRVAYSTASTTSSTGALRVDGGLGVGLSLFTGSNVQSGGRFITTSASTTHLGSGSVALYRSGGTITTNAGDMVLQSDAVGTRDFYFVAGSSQATRAVIKGDGGLALGGAGSFGSGTGAVISVANATAAPSANPTGGGVLYAEAGAGKWRGSSGTITTFGPAEPHCPACGSDFGLEWENPRYGYLAVCVKCLSDHVGDAPWIRRDRSANGSPEPRQPQAPARSRREHAWK